MIETLKNLGIEVVERTGRAVALPSSATGVASVVKLARKAGRIVVPSWLPTEQLDGESIALSLERLDSVDEVAAADLTAVVGAGLTCAALDERVGVAGLYWPVSDVARPDAMAGDAIARAPGNWTREGNAVRRYTLGMTVLLPDGRLLKTGSRTVKWVTGYDLRQLFIGSWGTLGVVVSLIVRLESLTNRAATSERSEREFDGLEARADSGQGSAGGGLHVLERLKRELDPEGIFPPVSVIGTEPAGVTGEGPGDT